MWLMCSEASLVIRASRGSHALPSLLLLHCPALVTSLTVLSGVCSLQMHTVIDGSIVSHVRINLVCFKTRHHITDFVIIGPIKACIARCKFRKRVKVCMLKTVLHGTGCYCLPRLWEHAICTQKCRAVRHVIVRAKQHLLWKQPPFTFKFIIMPSSMDWGDAVVLGESSSILIASRPSMWLLSSYLPPEQCSFLHAWTPDQVYAAIVQAILASYMRDNLKDM